MQPRHYYTIFMFLALAVFLIARRLMPKTTGLQNEPLWKRIMLILAAFIGGSLGAKAPFVLSGGAGWFTREAWLTDGKTITTALLGAYLCVEFAKFTLSIKAKTGDSYALPLALALAVGRLGCFFNGCCYGMPTTMPWGVVFPSHGIQPRHPTQIYEVLFHLFMALVLWRMVITNALQNHQLKFYLIAYGLYRFLTEFIRPEPRVIWEFTFYQGVAVLLIVAMVVHWIIDAILQPRTAVDFAHTRPSSTGDAVLKH